MVQCDVLLTPQQEMERIGMGKFQKSKTAFERFQKRPFLKEFVVLVQQETETIEMGHARKSQNALELFQKGPF